MQDAVARGNDIDVLKREFSPLNEMEAIRIATLFNSAILSERIGLITAVFNRQGVIDHQLGRHHRIDQRRIAALGGDGIA